MKGLKANQTNYTYSMFLICGFVLNRSHANILISLGRRDDDDGNTAGGSNITDDLVDSVPVVSNVRLSVVDAIQDQ